MNNIVLQKTWVQGRPVVVDNLLGTAFTGEAGAHTFKIAGVDAAQETVTISGTITGKLLAANNVTISLSGSIEDGCAVVTLTDECYDVPGRFIFSVYATSGDTTLCLYCAVGNIMRTDSQVIAYPTESLPNITSLMADLEQILADWPADYSQLQSDVSSLKSAFEQVGYSALTFSRAGNGFIHVSDGIVRNSTTNSYTNYIDVSYLNSIKYKRQGYTASSVSVGMAFYNANKTYISGSSIAGAASQSANGYCSMLYETKVPSGAYYARFSFYTDVSTYGNFELYGESKLSGAVSQMDSVNQNTFPSLLVPFTKTREKIGVITDGYFNGFIHGLYYNISYNQLSAQLRRLVTGNGELIGGVTEIATALNDNNNYTIHLTSGVYDVKLTLLQGEFNNTSNSAQSTTRMLFYDKTSKEQKIVVPCAFSAGFALKANQSYNWQFYCDHEDDYALVTEFLGQLFGRVAAGGTNCEFYYSIEKQSEKALSSARRNVQAAARQLTDIEWSPIRAMPFSNNQRYIEAGTQCKGIPYSSTRSNCKYVGQHVSLYTFMSALQDPRSVLYTRIMNIGALNLCTTYYGLTCFTFTSYSCGRGLGKWDNAIASKYNGEDIEISPYDIQPGDTIECMIDRETIPEPATVRPSMHTMLIYDVTRDNYNRITRVVLAEGYPPCARINASITFSEFLNDYIYNNPSYNYRVYRKGQNDFGAYTKSDVVKGFPDEDIGSITYPDIMPEYGDRACVEAGENVVINVINPRTYTSIKVYKDNTLIDTKTTIADFTMSNMAYGTYKFEITDGTNTSESTLIVADVNATYDSTTKLLTFSSANAIPMFAASYRVGEGSMNGAQNLVKYFTKEEKAQGYADMTGVVGQYYSEVQVGFLTDYGVAMWWSNKIPNQWIPWTPPT